MNSCAGCFGAGYGSVSAVSCSELLPFVRASAMARCLPLSCGVALWHFSPLLCIICGCLIIFTILLILRGPVLVDVSAFCIFHYRVSFSPFLLVLSCSPFSFSTFYLCSPVMLFLLLLFNMLVYLFPFLCLPFLSLSTVILIFRILVPFHCNHMFTGILNAISVLQLSNLYSPSFIIVIECSFLQQITPQPPLHQPAEPVSEPALQEPGSGIKGWR